MLAKEMCRNHRVKFMPFSHQLIIGPSDQSYDNNKTYTDRVVRSMRIYFLDKPVNIWNAYWEYAIALALNETFFAGEEPAIDNACAYWITALRNAEKIIPSYIRSGLFIEVSSKAQKYLNKISNK